MGEKQGHTPGPWVARRMHTGGYDIFDPRERDVVTVYGGGVDTESREANARLIAAAPDLLAAVWALIEHFERVDGNASHKAVIKQATDAIGKATNRPSPTGEDSPANEGEA